jgi:hypothetical protein
MINFNSPTNFFLLYEKINKKMNNKNRTIKIKKQIRNKKDSKKHRRKPNDELISAKKVEKVKKE